MMMMSVGRRPARLPTASAATGSVGETAAPSAIAAARPIPGTNRSTPMPTSMTVASTSPIDRLMTAPRFFRMASRDELSAAL